jgi:hypothetical protein
MVCWWTISHPGKWSSAKWTYCQLGCMGIESDGIMKLSGSQMVRSSGGQVVRWSAGR